MPWYLAFEEGTDLDEPELYWITVHNNSLSKLFEEIDTIIEKEIPSGCDVRYVKTASPQKVPLPWLQQVIYSVLVKWMMGPFNGKLL